MIINDTEAELFAELRELCHSPGYVHAIAHLCHRDNVIQITGQMKAEDLQKLHPHDRLNRNEISTLISLLVQVPMDLRAPTQKVLGEYVERTDARLQQLHNAMAAEGFNLFLGKDGKPDLGALKHGSVIRETIFYANEGAYIFQYRDLAADKYAQDAAWLRERKGFDAGEGRAIAKAMAQLQDERVSAFGDFCSKALSSKWRMIAGPQ